MPLSHQEWTVEMLDALPEDGNRYEVIGGELFVSPAPTTRHQRALGRLYSLLDPFVQRIGRSDVLFAPVDVRFSSRDGVQPDLLVLPRIEGRPANLFKDVGRLELAVEIISPSSRLTDRTRKRELYRRYGVPEYWVVDLDELVIERFTPDASEAVVVADQLLWRPYAEHAPLSIDVAAFFASVDT